MSVSEAACIVSKMSGMCYIREDVTPSVLEWKAIEQLNTITIPLNTLVNLQATKESSPKMILKVIHKPPQEDEKDIRLTFTNRPAMNKIKDALQTIISRQRTVIHDDNQGNSDTAKSSNKGTPVPSSSSGNAGSGSNSNTNGTSNDGSTTGGSLITGVGANVNLSDETLLKNHQLQQKLLLEDRNLRNIFTQSVINYKLSPQIFWSTRINLLRTYALTINQHRGPYNVLSTIKPVATSDNQVNVNVTRNTINEIFDTYPIVKKAFTDLVPSKFQEGEFWSRFFNSKLFRRLRGDKINNTNERGDMVLDKYLYVNQDHLNKPSTETSPEGVAGSNELSSVTDSKNELSESQDNNTGVKNKFIDLLGNEEDNSTKLPTLPDFTMKFEDDSKDGQKSEENEMIILMKNMNNLSSKMITQSNQSGESEKDAPASGEGLEEYEHELNLNDLNDYEDDKFIDLNINSNINENIGTKETIAPEELNKYLGENKIQPSVAGINLVDVYNSKDAINESASEINNLIRLNFKTFKLINNTNNHSDNDGNNLLSPSLVEEIYLLNITINEFLTHFWNLFLFESNPNQLKKIFNNVKVCKKNFIDLKQKSIDHILSNSQFGTQANAANPNASTSSKRDKVINDLNYCLSSIVNPLDKALSEYAKAVKASRDQQSSGNGFSANGEGGMTASQQEESEVDINNEVNENGKRAIKA